MTDSIWGNIFKDIKRPEDAATDILRRIPIFEDLGARDLAYLLDTLHVREYAAEEVVFSQGVPGFGMYIIISGEVDIVYEPTGQPIARLGDGEFFGELALLVSSPRSAAAIAHSPCRMYGFFHSDLKSLIKRRPKMGVKIVTRLAGIIGERLKKSNEQVQALQNELNEYKEKQCEG
jgi:CRP-like cAMP-binding protein